MEAKLKALREKRAAGDNGFTLIELLVVVVIIGVLIAIAIPLYLNYRKGAENKSASSDVRGAISTLEQCFADKSPSIYPTAVATDGTLTGCGTSTGAIKVSSGNTINYKASTDNLNYIVEVIHTGNGSYSCYASAAGGSVKTESATFGTAYVAACA